MRARVLYSSLCLFFRQQLSTRTPFKLGTCSILNYIRTMYVYIFIYSHTPKSCRRMKDENNRHVSHLPEVREKILIPGPWCRSKLLVSVIPSSIVYFVPLLRFYINLCNSVQLLATTDWTYSSFSNLNRSYQYYLTFHEKKNKRIFTTLFYITRVFIIINYLLQYFSDIN